MAMLKILTWNVRGLGDRAKRTAVLSHLKSQQAEISILVATHLTGQKHPGSVGRTMLHILPTPVGLRS